ncbi:MAG: amino acid ABC transporter ATP-binding protein [Rhodospirillales bacterium]|nr:amino acid ABC transporter ATP-binding protein [Rhodospirillales bacterium]
MAEPLVRIRNVKKSFGRTVVLDGVDLDVATGETAVIIGASGSGKTTLLRCVNALEDYDDGSIAVDGVEVRYREGAGAARKLRGERELSAIRADIGMVFQLFNLFPHLTARENVMLGLVKVRGKSKAEAKDAAEHWLAKVGLADRMDNLPSQLSGGQQQRVGIARAVAMDPKVLLLDEITSALDPELVGEVLAVVRQLAADGMTMIVVTHEMTFARDVGTHLVFMDGGQKVEEGSPRELLKNPRHDRLKAFLSRLEMH